MIQRLAVFSSDQVNRLGYQMPIGTLSAALDQGWEAGQPLFLSHDRHRLEGWTRALGLHLEPGMARLTGLCFVPEDESESEKLKESLYGFLGRQLSALVVPHLEELKTKLGAHHPCSAQPIYASCAALLEPGLAVRIFPDQFANRDKHGMVLLKDLHAMAPGVFEKDGLLFFASSFLRRSLSRHNTLNEPLLEQLHALSADDSLSVKIRLDEDLVGLAHTYMRPLEFQYWWGPRFNDDLESIPVGVTQHSANDSQRAFFGVDRTEFWWHEQNRLKTLECEEVLNIPSLGVGRDSFGCRYAHSIVDPDSGLPTHLDGAIRLYSEESMIARMERDMMHAGRSTEYVKLWRVDNPISVAAWKEIITHHFRDNELVGEYLGGVDESADQLPHLVEPEADPLFRYVPTTMAPGDGVRLSVAFHPRPDGERPERAIVSFDTFGDASQRSYYNTVRHETCMRFLTCFGS